jgi:DNA-binding NarL/FixJ family response regulator
MTFKTAAETHGPQTRHPEPAPRRLARGRTDGHSADGRPVKVLIVDQHLFVRSGMKMLIESDAGMRVVGAESDCREASTYAASEEPDVILLDIEPGEESRLACVAALAEFCAGAKVLVTSGIKGPEFLAECVRAGASGLVAKDSAPEVLFKAIRKVHAGELWFERSTLGAVFSALAQRGARPNPDAGKIASLTARELEIIELVGEGLKNKQIAERLFICEATVCHHLTSIFSKLELTDRLALVIYAYQHGLAKLPGGDS